MEGKSLIMSALLLSLVLGQIQVEAKKKSCCPTTIARNIYNACRLGTSSRETCASISGCILQDSPTCAPPNTHDILENTAGAYEFCKLGCSSSVCGAMITLEESDASEVVRGAVQKCTQACSAICTKASISTE